MKTRIHYLLILVFYFIGLLICHAQVERGLRVSNIVRLENFAQLKETRGLILHAPIAPPGTGSAALLLSNEGQLKPENTGSRKQRESYDLRPGERVERELYCGKVHSYMLTAQSGQFIRVIVEQKGIDVIVTTFAPSGQKVRKMDSSKGARGPESISVIAEDTGSHRLEVKSYEKMCEPARYEIRIEDLREPNADDGMRIRAETALNEGADLHVVGTAESLRASIDKFNVALPLFRALGDHSTEALTLNIMGLNRTLPAVRLVPRIIEFDPLCSSGQSRRSISSDSTNPNKLNRREPPRRIWVRWKNER